MLAINHITVRSQKVTRPLTLAVCPDFHDGDVRALCHAVQGADAILIVGDLVDRHAHRSNGYDNAVRFLQDAPDIAPTFYSLGNHERKHQGLGDYWPQVARSRVTVLDDGFVHFGGIVLGGLSSIRAGEDAPERAVQLAQKQPFLRDMASQEGYKLLMCHHPEYFAEAVSAHAIDLTLSGHAHGGQVRIGRQGLYAPGQGILPRLTSGFYAQERLLVSRGVTNATWAPRIHCACEVILLHLTGEDERPNCDECKNIGR